jgi:hypothetical protein
LPLVVCHPARAATQRAYARRPWLSSSGEALFRQGYAAGLYKNSPLARWYAQPLERTTPLAEAGVPAATQVELALDALANDRDPVTCSPLCTSLGISQVEPTVAVDGLDVLVGWNDLETRCFTASQQNYGWSTDGGASFTDGGHYPNSDVGGTLYGDPSHAVNRRTHEFYMAGIHAGGGATFSGVGAAMGHFNASGFTIDAVKRAVTNPDPSHEFFDKPWMTVDSLSGNVYFTWTDFTGLGSYIEFARCDANLNLTGPIQRLSGNACGAQFSVPVVGPEGELYVMWKDYSCDPLGAASIVVRKSTDFGATFEPQAEVARYIANEFNGGPGFLRGFASNQAGIDIDRSEGPHRGRVYVAWDACVDYTGARSDQTTTFEVEPNGTRAQAQTLVPGGKLRGTKSGNEHDWYRFDATALQTFYLETVISFDVPGGVDSSTAGIRARLYCVDDAGTLSLAVDGGLTSAGMLYTLRRTGTYYLELFGITSEIGPYIAWTGLITPAQGDVARDHRDQLLSWSDDGVHWSPPQRIVDSPIGYDAQYPWPSVDGKGRVHCTWMDFRIDDRCQLPRSIQVMTSSGDGGVTWGPNLTISDEPSYWDPNVCQSNGNNQGDYQQTAADGDLVVAAFTDQRLGDPDIFVDASVYRTEATCAGEASVFMGSDTTITFTLANQGNFARELGWRVEDTRGWVIGVNPAPTGSHTFGVGEVLTLAATVRLEDCAGDSSAVTLVHWDPAIPGYEERCSTVVHCEDSSTPALVSLVETQVSAGLVSVTWYAPWAGAEHATVWRRGTLEGWKAVGEARASGDGYLTFEDHEALAEGRYAYRIEIDAPGGTVTSSEAWVDVPGPRFALERVQPNPAGGLMTVDLALESGPATLELYDVGGRRVLSREVGRLGPGTHQVRIGEAAGLAAGVYLLRLSQGTHSASARVVLMP